MAACDRPPAVLRDRTPLVEVTPADLDRAGGHWSRLQSAAVPDESWLGHVSPDHLQTDLSLSDLPPEALPEAPPKALPETRLAMNLLAPPEFAGAASRLAGDLGAGEVIARIEASGLQGRGGAGFPAGFKWKAVRAEAEPERYVVLNADEGEPGTFKDREVMLRRPDLVVEGPAIAARAVGANSIYCYLRGEFQAPWRALQSAIDELTRAGHLDGVSFHLHAGHGAYICGEETALIDALEGKRGMPRLKPPYPTQVGLWDKPTLVHNAIPA